MGTTLNLIEFLEMILTEENQDFEHKVYILQQFSSKIRKEFFNNNFMPFLKEIMYVLGEIDKILATKVISIPGKSPRMIDVDDTLTSDVLEASKVIFRDLLIEGNKRWNILLDSVDFIPNANNGTVKISMPSFEVGLFFNITTLGDKKIILFKDIGIESLENWDWEITWEYDIPKETIKHALKEKINTLF